MRDYGAKATRLHDNTRENCQRGRPLRNRCAAFIRGAVARLVLPPAPWTILGRSSRSQSRRASVLLVSRMVALRDRPSLEPVPMPRRVGARGRQPRMVGNGSARELDRFADNRGVWTRRGVQRRRNRLSRTCGVEHVYPLPIFWSTLRARIGGRLHFRLLAVRSRPHIRGPSQPASDISRPAGSAALCTSPGWRHWRIGICRGICAGDRRSVPVRGRTDGDDVLFRRDYAGARVAIRLGRASRSHHGSNMAGAVRIYRRRDPAVALSVLHAYRRHSARRVEFACGLLGLRPELLPPDAYRRNRTSAAVASRRGVISWKLRRGERLPEPATNCDYRDMEPFALARADGARVARDFGGDFHLRTGTAAPYRRRHFVREAVENGHARSASQERAAGAIHDVRVSGRRGYR